MGLTAHDMSDMGRLAQLAVNPQGASREEIYLAVASLYRIQGTGLNDRERELMREILRRLTRDVEMAIRIALAERLADDTIAPHDLILLLWTTPSKSPARSSCAARCSPRTTCLRLIAEGDVGHQEAVAARPISAYRSPTRWRQERSRNRVLVALVRNATAKISDSAYQTLVEKSRGMPSLQEPLAQPGRSAAPMLATRMCDWVSDALKTYITQVTISAPQSHSTLRCDQAETASNASTAAPRLEPARGRPEADREARRSGQLKAGFLMRVLHQGQIDLFDLALASSLESARGRAPAPQILRRRPLRRGAGLPRRRHRPLRLRHRVQSVAPAGCPGDHAQETRAISAVFDRFSQADATAELARPSSAAALVELVQPGDSD